MPSLLAIRFVRIIPLLVILAIVAVIVFFIVQFKYSRPKAKEVLIVAFTWINGIGAAFFALASLYAWIEQNALAFDFMACFCLTFLIGLAITKICKAVFLKHHPNYRFSGTRATIQSGWHNLIREIKRRILKARYK